MKDDKILGIRRGFLEIIIIVIILMLLLGVVVGNATAANVSANITTNVTAMPTHTINASRITPAPTITYAQAQFSPISTIDTTPMTTPNIVPNAQPNVTIRRIDQGGCVQLNETIDMAGIGWYTGYIAYYGKYRTEMTEGVPDSLVKIYEVKPWNLRKFYIAPDMFRDYTGWWYSHYETDEAGNSRLFKVSNNCNITPDRATVVENKTVLVTGGITVPPKYIDGIQFILSRNTTTKLGTPGNKSRWWLFGDYTNKQYNIPIENNSLITFDRNLTNSLPLGRYTLVFVNPGANNITEEIYDKENESIASPFRGIDPVFIGGVTQDRARQLLASRVNSSIDDTFEKLVIDLQDPYIEVRQLDMGTATNNMSTMTMSGYTNTNPGDTITIEFDKGNIDRQLIRANTWTTVVDITAAPNAYRTWFKTVLFNPNDFSASIHTLTVTTKSGATASVPVPIRRELAESYKPPEYIQFIDNNPFVPTPTPIPAPPPVVVTVVQTVVQEKIVLQEKIVPVDPYPYMIGGIIAVIVSAYVFYSIARAIVNERRKRKFDINKGEL